MRRRRCRRADVSALTLAVGATFVANAAIDLVARQPSVHRLDAQAGPGRRVQRSLQTRPPAVLGCATRSLGTAPQDGASRRLIAQSAADRVGNDPVYKICTAAEWREAEHAGAYRGSAVDRSDGFIHFSTAGAGRRDRGASGSPASATSCWSRSMPVRSATA